MDDSEKFEILSNFVSDLARSQRTIEESLQPVKKEMSEENGLYDLDALYTYEVIGNIHKK